MEQNNEHNEQKLSNKQQYLIYAIVFVVILIIAAVTATYAYFQFSVNYDNTLAEMDSSLECINLSLSEGTTDIGLTYNYPITDNSATSGGATPITVTVTNNCNSERKYTLALSTMALTGSEDNYIEDSKIRYKVVKNNSDYKGINYLSSLDKVGKDSQTYDSLTGENGELNTKYTDYTLKDIYALENVVSIGTNESNTYEIYLWVDYYEGDSAMYLSSDAEHNEYYDGLTEGQSFAAAISLSFNSDTEVAPVYLYNKINEINPSGLQNSVSVPGDTLYRYVGSEGNTGIDNYICLGADTCTSGSDDMYRIIGIDPSTKQIKVIKETPYSTSSQWNTIASDIIWEDSSLYSTLNTTWLESISFGELLENRFWYVGNVMASVNNNYYEGDNDNKLTILYSSRETQTTNPAKVGALSLADYYFAHTEDRNWNKTNDLTNWMHLHNNGNSGVSEWNMLRRTSASVWVIFSSGGVSTADMANSYAVRPTFYLTSDIEWVSGDGKVGSPFIIK